MTKIDPSKEKKSLKTKVNEILWFQCRILKFLDVDFNQPDRKSRTTIFQLFNCILPVFCIVLMINFLIHNFGDIQLITETIAPLLSVIAGCAKLSLLIWKKNSFIVILHKLKLNLFKSDNPEHRFMFDRTTAMEKLLTKFYFAAWLANSSYYLILPIINHYVLIAKGENTEWDLPVRVKVFYLEKVPSPYFQISYIALAYVAYDCSCGSFLVDTMFYGFTTYAACCFKLLQTRLRLINCGRKFGRYNGGRLPPELRQTVIDHIELLNLCEQLSRSYSVIVFLQFLVSSLQLSVIGYQLTLSFGGIDLLKYLNFLGTIFLQLYIYAYGGTMLMSDSEGLASEFYSIDWYELDPNVGRVIKLAILRAQRPVRMQGGFFYATMETYSKIVQAAFSYITLIKTME